MQNGKKKFSKMVFLFIILESIKSRTPIQEEAIIDQDITHINRDKDRSIVSGIKWSRNLGKHNTQNTQTKFDNLLVKYDTTTHNEHFFKKYILMSW